MIVDGALGPDYGFGKCREDHVALMIASSAINILVLKKISFITDGNT